MIRTVRIFFLNLALREKSLLVVFVAVGVAIWASSFSGVVAEFWRGQRATTVALADQAHFLRNQAAIEATAEKAAEDLVPAKTLDGLRLFTTVQELAAEAGLRQNTRVDPASTVLAGELSVHTLNFQITNADWAAVKKFYYLLEQRSPYIALKKTTLQPNRANFSQVTFVATVSSVQRQ